MFSYRSTSLLMLATAIFTTAGLATSCGMTDTEPTPVPEYKDQEVQGSVLGQDWQVQSARVRSPEETDRLVIDVYGQDYDDLCSDLRPQKPSPKPGDAKLVIEDIPAEKGRYTFVSDSQSKGPDRDEPELSFSRRDQEPGNWGGLPYGRGSVEIVELTGDTLRAEIVGVHGSDDANKVSGWFEAQRCGCITCPGGAK